MPTFMEKYFNISLDSLEDSRSSGHSEPGDVVDKNTNGKKTLAMATILKKNNPSFRSCRSLPTCYSSNGFPPAGCQMSKSKLNLPNKHGKYRMDLERVKQTKKASYLEIFRKRIGFNSSLLSQKEEGDSHFKDLSGQCSMIEIPESRASKGVGGFSLKEVTHDHCSWKSSRDSLGSSSMNGTCVVLGDISQQGTPNEKSIISQRSASSNTGRGKYVKKDSRQVTKNYLPSLEPNHLTPSDTGKSISPSACGGRVNRKSKHLPNKSPVICPLVNSHEFSNQNKLEKFLIRNAYGNSVSDFNCRFKPSPQNLKIQKNIVKSAVNNGLKEVSRNSNEKIATRGHIHHELTAKAKHLKTMEKIPQQNNILKETDSRLKKRNVSKPSTAAKKNKNEKNDSNLIVNLEFLMDRHHRESLLLKKINEEVLKTPATI